MVILKKTIVALLLIISNLIFAQSNLIQKNKLSKIGIYAGVGYNTQVQDKNEFFKVSYSYYNKFSPYIGFVYRDSINSWLSIKTSLYYIQRGMINNYKYESPPYSLYSEQSFTGHYISFPIKLNFNYKRFFMGIGVEGSILLTAHHKVHIKEVTPTYVNENSLDAWYGEKFYQPVDAGYNFSFGYKIKNFEIEMNVYHGLIQPPKFQYFTSQHNEQKYAYQQTFMLGINYFPIFKKFLPKKIKE